MATTEPRTGRVHPVELTAVVATRATMERRVVLGLSERRLTVLGLVLTVGLGTAVPPGFAVDGWRGAFVGGIVGFALVAFVLRSKRLSHQAARFARWVAPE